MDLNLQTWIQLGMFVVAMAILYFSMTSDSS
jgi:hypothetical protein